MPKEHQLKKLQEELVKERTNIKTDSYPMSIGEVLSNFNAQEINLSPAYQRLYRWKNHQKTRFIESIFLGIPIPAIFVSQQKSGTWDVVDGVQRLSTILEFTGDLSNDSNLKLTEAKLLPSLEGLTWEDIPMDLKRIFRKSKLNFNIILTENSVKSQYELFQRLNTGGTELSDQEIRNCLLIMLNKDVYNQINELKKYENFLKLLLLKSNDEKVKREYPMELIIRYLIGKSVINYSNYNSSNTVSEFLDNETINFIENINFNIQEEIKLFKSICDFLYLNLGTSTFKKYYKDDGKFKGAFSTIIFDLLLPGISLNFQRISNYSKQNFIEIIKHIYELDEVDKILNRGTRPIKRFELATKFSKKYFKNLGE